MTQATILRAQKKFVHLIVKEIPRYAHKLYTVGFGLTTLKVLAMTLY